MAELDYAFVADFAKVERSGTLTTVGASWTFLDVRELPAVHQMAIAGRVRVRIDEGPVSLRVTLEAPENAYKIATEAELAPEAGARPYAGGVLGLLFALNLMVPIPTLGVYRVDISLEGEHVRHLAFEACESGA